MDSLSFASVGASVIKGDALRNGPSINPQSTGFSLKFVHFSRQVRDDDSDDIESTKDTNRYCASN